MEAAMLETAVGGILLAIVVSMFLLALIVLIFVLAREGKKPLAVSATNHLAERVGFAEHARGHHASIAVDAKQEFGIARGSNTSPGLVYIGQAIAGPPPAVGAAARRQGRSIKLMSDRPSPDPDDAARKMLEMVRASNKALLDAGKKLAAALERVDKADQ
jgi:hypothetical protein